MPGLLMQQLNVQYTSSVCSQKAHAAFANCDHHIMHLLQARGKRRQQRGKARQLQVLLSFQHLMMQCACICDHCLPA